MGIDDLKTGAENSDKKKVGINLWDPEDLLGQGVKKRVKKNVKNTVPDTSSQKDRRDKGDWL